MTLKQAAQIHAIKEENADAGWDFIVGAKWMCMRTLQIINEVSVHCMKLQKSDAISIETLNVIDQFCDKIYEQLKEIEK